MTKPKRRINRKCLHCGELYKRVRKDRKYCSKSCKNMASRARVKARNDFLNSSIDALAAEVFKPVE
jgi:predicted nucleic acid-binding Zn ribbon protein